MRRLQVGRGGRNAGLFVALLVAMTLVAGCSGSSSKASHSAAADYANSAAVAQAPEAAASSAAAGGAASGSGAADTPSDKSAGILSQVNLRSTAVIETAELTVATKDVTGQANQATAIAEQAGGGQSGEVQNAGTASGVGATTDLTLQVPPAALQAVLVKLKALGTERSLQLTSQDVTGQVADVNSRVTSAEASIAELRTLFDRASNVSDIIALEGDLSQREADLESLQAQQRALSAQTTFATITLHLVTPSAPVPVKHHHSNTGFGHGLSRGWHGFTTSVAWVLTAVGAALPFLVVVLVLAGGAFWIRRRTRHQPAAVALADSGPGVGE